MAPAGWAPLEADWAALERDVLAPLQPLAAGCVERAQAATTEAAGGEEGLALDRARALATLRCANVRCRNLAGAAEADVRGRKCSGCFVVRYCGAACQQADWRAGHKRVCASLKAERAAAAAGVAAAVS